MSEKRVKIAFLAIGSNLGNRKKNIYLTKSYLKKNKITILKSSKKYESLSWPNKENPKFINIVLKVKTFLTPHNLMNLCLKIEKKIGRTRNTKNEPRVCDIDIIDYEGIVIKNKKYSKLSLPHPKMHKRNFVLLPLFEISKTWIHPIKKIKIKELVNSLKTNDLKTIKLM